MVTSSWKLGIVVALVVVCAPSPARGQDAATLKARHEQLREQLAHNAFNRPLYLESSESSGHLKGEIYARLAQPYRVAGPVMQDIDQWCDLLILHLNVKACRIASSKGVPTLIVNLGRKFDQPLEDTYRVDFKYRVEASTPDYLRLELRADEGPVGTRDYRMRAEVVALESGQSFLHLSYSYEFGIAAGLAMRGYLATGGRDKRGFSVVGHQPDGKPIHIDGTRGVIERNTMRYFIAIEAYLNALATPKAQRLEKRLNDWYSGIERYPEQLHELERNQYLAMKHREVNRIEKLRSGEVPG
ncbi:MAG: hypothetical protein M3N38_06110 [Pseudomonadota bacterium]|nr:hypothetical protein [Pseudomonadota bacterium]